MRVVVLKGCWETRCDKAEKPWNAPSPRRAVSNRSAHRAQFQTHCWLSTSPQPRLAFLFSCWELGHSPLLHPYPVFVDKGLGGSALRTANRAAGGNWRLEEGTGSLPASAGHHQQQLIVSHSSHPIGFAVLPALAEPPDGNFSVAQRLLGEPPVSRAG